MAGSFKRIVFSLLLIVFAAAILLWSDRHNRRDKTVGARPEVDGRIGRAIGIQAC